MAITSNEKKGKALVGIIMGSTSDWETMQHAAHMLEELCVPHETRVVSAHRTPDLLFEYAGSAEKRGIEVAGSVRWVIAQVPVLPADSLCSDQVVNGD